MLRKVEVSCVEETEAEGKLRTIVEILSDAVCASLKHNGSVRKQSPLGARRIELTTGGTRAGIGTQDWRCGVQRAKALRVLGKAKR